MAAIDDDAQPNVPRRRTHRLLSEVAVRARFRSEVADYVLEVRAELVTRYGDVDTYRRFATDLAGRYRRADPTEIRRIARRRAEHFNTPAGPPWRTVEEVLRHVVEDDRREACRHRFAALYLAARGEPPPGDTNAEADDPAGVAHGLSDDDGQSAEVLRLQARLAAMRIELRAAQTDLYLARNDVADGRAERDELRTQLDSRSHQVADLRRQLDFRWDQLCAIWEEARTSAVPRQRSHSGAWTWVLPPREWPPQPSGPAVTGELVRPYARAAEFLQRSPVPVPVVVEVAGPREDLDGEVWNGAPSCSNPGQQHVIPSGDLVLSSGPVKPVEPGADAGSGADTVCSETIPGDELQGSRLGHGRVYSGRHRRHEIVKPDAQAFLLGD